MRIVCKNNKDTEYNTVLIFEDTNSTEFLMWLWKDHNLYYYNNYAGSFVVTDNNWDFPEGEWRNDYTIVYIKEKILDALIKIKKVIFYNQRNGQM